MKITINQKIALLISIIVAGSLYLGVSMGNDYLLRLINKHRADAGNIATVNLVNRLYERAEETGEIQLRSVILNEQGQIQVDEQGRVIQSDAIRLIVQSLGDAGE